jgi:hypothetical protein
VQPATLVVERAYGMLEVHHEDKGQVLQRRRRRSSSLGVKEEDRHQAAQVVSNTIIRSIEPYARDDHRTRSASVR